MKFDVITNIVEVAYVEFIKKTDPDRWNKFQEEAAKSKDGTVVNPICVLARAAKNPTRNHMADVYVVDLYAKTVHKVLAPHTGGVPDEELSDEDKVGFNFIKFVEAEDKAFAAEALAHFASLVEKQGEAIHGKVTTWKMSGTKPQFN